ncbi:MAG: bifunctional [glutamine synthetase] adenylyltransferase/[glutamine synthetase]-adenylyl-L-tyrosine phosphorylase [Pseudomonadota bacterium]
MTGLSDRIATAPPPFDPARGQDVARCLPEALRTGPLGELVTGTAGSSPYLARLLERHGGWLADRVQDGAEDAFAALLKSLDHDDTADLAATAKTLRLTKGRAALLIALADLGGVWDLPTVTNALSDLADRAMARAVADLLADALRRRLLPGLDEDALASGAGYCVIAMGKLGARELNYSSDIDLICLFDQDRFDPADFAAAKAGFIRITRGLVQLLSEQTAEGYVFRTDLRLRPSPSTTPVCLALEAAERYYEGHGRTWERAAHIKARAAAGDIAAGSAYLTGLTPFVWRRYLDFAAIEDTQGMLLKIRRKKGRFTADRIPGHDVKLDPGGIREIEFFAQTRQLIMGGRNPDLRKARTCAALAALARADLVEEETASLLTDAYRAHRTLEHRLQMIEDAQTQTIPSSAEARARVAHLCGWTDCAAWEQDIADRLAAVHRLTEAFFGPTKTAPRPRPDPDPDLDEAALADGGFGRPGDAHRVIERWRSGRLPALRTARAQNLYRKLEPRVIAELARAAHPDDAIAAFDRFLGGLPAGVQVFSLFTANPHLLELVVGIFAAAPRLADHLGRRPQALDALLGPDFFDPFRNHGTMGAELAQALAAEPDYERQLDLTRRWAREQSFRAGVLALRGIADEVETGTAFSLIAEACLTALYPRVLAEFARRHGPPPGRGLAVVAMGKLGTREMTATSDLDLITIYDAGAAEASDGPRPLPPATYYPRLTQALVAAVTAPTAEGRLYEVDMRLRPSGRQGPVAVSLATFERYQRERAWVWEHLALTRARVVAGPADLAAQVSAEIARALARRAGDPEVAEAAAEMRYKLIEAHRAERGDPWSLKHAAGGLMEIEFLAQTGALLQGLGTAQPARASLAALVDRGWLSRAQAETLSHGLSLQSRLQQVLRVAHDGASDPRQAGEGLRAALATATGARNFDALEATLTGLQHRAAGIIERRLAQPSGISRTDPAQKRG